MIPIVTIEGPTAVGKSKFAFEIAKILDTDIISADSRQVYKYLDIGTAKPSLRMLKEIPHHLVSIIDPKENYNAGRFTEDADEVIADLHKRDRIPLIVGGTGFYVKSLKQGLFKAPLIPNYVREKLESESNKLGSRTMFEKLEQIDPIAAARIDPNDLQRIIRALEVFEYTDKPISKHWQEQRGDEKYIPFSIFVTRERNKLYEAINNRVDTMIDSGLLQEVDNLLNSGYTFDDPGLNTLGYKEFRMLYENRNSLHEVADKIKQHTRNYAKRQFTWYRKCKFDLTLSVDEIIISKVIKEIGEYMNNIYKKESR